MADLREALEEIAQMASEMGDNRDRSLEYVLADRAAIKAYAEKCLAEEDDEKDAAHQLLHELQQEASKATAELERLKVSLEHHRAAMARLDADRGNALVERDEARAELKVADETNGSAALSVMRHLQRAEAAEQACAQMRAALLALFEEHTDCASCDACEPARRLLPGAVGGHVPDAALASPVGRESRKTLDAITEEQAVLQGYLSPEQARALVAKVKDACVLASISGVCDLGAECGDALCPGVQVAEAVRALDVDALLAEASR